MEIEKKISDAVVATYRDMCAIDASRGTTFIKLDEGCVRIVVQKLSGSKLQEAGSSTVDRCLQALTGAFSAMCDLKNELQPEVKNGETKS